MQQLVLFQLGSKAQSLNIAAEAILEKQSNISSSITASNRFDEDFIPQPADNDDADLGDIYDDYEDFDVCSRQW